jgi:tRNA(fMet)-specific endonuclease VapC
MTNISQRKAHNTIDPACQPERLPLTILDMDHQAAADAAIIRAQLEKKGTPIGPYDLLIAVPARSRNMTLATNNKKIDNLRIGNQVQ